MPPGAGGGDAKSLRSPGAAASHGVIERAAAKAEPGKSAGSRDAALGRPGAENALRKRCVADSCEATSQGLPDAVPAPVMSPISDAAMLLRERSVVNNQ